MTRLRRKWNEKDGNKMLQEEGRDPGAGWKRKSIRRKLKVEEDLENVEGHSGRGRK